MLRDCVRPRGAAAAGGRPSLCAPQPMNTWLAVLMGLTAAGFWALASMLLHPILDSEGGPRDYPRPRPDAVNFFKNLLAFTAFTILWLVSGSEVRGAEAWASLLVSGALGFALGDTLFFTAIPLCGVQTAAVVAQLNVPISVVMCWYWLDEVLSPAKLVAISVTLIGVWLVILSGRDSLSDLRVVARTPEQRERHRRGTLIAFTCALIFATSIVLGHDGFQNADLIAGSQARLIGGLVGGVLVSGFALSLRGRGGAERERLFDRGRMRALFLPLRDRRLTRALLPACLCGSVLCLLPFGYSLKTLEGGVVSVIGSTTPIFTLLLSLAFGEKPRGLAVIGTLVVFGGVAGLGFTAAAG